jgi:hypothetical protein
MQESRKMTWKRRIPTAPRTIQMESRSGWCVVALMGLGNADIFARLTAVK